MEEALLGDEVLISVHHILHVLFVHQCAVKIGVCRARQVHSLISLVQNILRRSVGPREAPVHCLGRCLFVEHLVYNKISLILRRVVASSPPPPDMKIFKKFSDV